jgi:hypothetical protein
MPITDSETLTHSTRPVQIHADVFDARRRILHRDRAAKSAPLAAAGPLSSRIGVCASLSTLMRKFLDGGDETADDV